MPRDFAPSSTFFFPERNSSVLTVTLYASSSIITLVSPYAAARQRCCVLPPR
ncbi:hypothetical protein FORC066_3298 [Yersinia enterocolitica]|nr:hypothetical protein FORC066_3298 [Yersinia enterocolitica]